MQRFQYEAPTSLDAALRLLAGAGEAGPGLLAGGTDLLVQMRGGLRRPRAVIDLKRIPELMGVHLDEEGLRLGAAVSCRALSGREDVRRWFPGLLEAAELIGSMQIQGRATVGGNLCNASPAADTVPALMALGARAVVVGPDGERELPVADFVVAPGRTALRPGELLRELRIARPESGAADAYLRFIPRGEMDIAVVGAGVALQLGTDGTCRAARVALGAVADRPILVPAAADALIGSRLDDDALERAGRAAGEAGAPISDKRGTASFRRRIAAVLVRRAAARAAERARAARGAGGER